MIDGRIKERLESQLRVDSQVTWEPYDKTLPRSAYEKVHYCDESGRKARNFCESQSVSAIDFENWSKSMADVICTP